MFFISFIFSSHAPPDDLRLDFFYHYVTSLVAREGGFIAIMAITFLIYVHKFK